MNVEIVSEDQISRGNYLAKNGRKLSEEVDLGFRWYVQKFTTKKMTLKVVFDRPD